MSPSTKNTDIYLYTRAAAEKLNLSSRGHALQAATKMHVAAEVDVVELRAQADAYMPASNNNVNSLYILKFLTVL